MELLFYLATTGSAVGQQLCMHGVIRVQHNPRYQFMTAFDIRLNRTLLSSLPDEDTKV